MPVIYEPTLVKSTAETTVNNTGGNVEIAFSLGINEGVKIEKVILTADGSTGVAGTLDIGLNLKPSAGSPAAAGDVFEDDDVLCAVRARDDGAGANDPAQPIFDFSHDSVYIVKDITLQLYGAGAVARAGYCKIYYKRVKFSDAELGNILRNY